MYLTRCLGLRRSLLLRASNEESTRVAIKTIVQNKTNLKQYQALVNSRKLWEQSGTVENKNAFKSKRALRDVAEPLKKDPPLPFRGYEAPEEHAAKDIHK